MRIIGRGLHRLRVSGAVQENHESNPALIHSLQLKGNEAGSGINAFGQIVMCLYAPKQALGTIEMEADGLTSPQWSTDWPLKRRRAGHDVGEEEN